MIFAGFAANPESGKTGESGKPHDGLFGKTGRSGKPHDGLGGKYVRNVRLFRNSLRFVYG